MSEHESDFYQLQSDGTTCISLVSDTEMLHEHQRRLQQLAAKVAMDLSVVTEVITERSIQQR
jgi:hypothetical protein